MVSPDGCVQIRSIWRLVSRRNWASMHRQHGQRGTGRSLYLGPAVS